MGAPIHNFPTEIGNCTNMYRLSLSGNYLDCLPSEIGNCIRLDVHLHINGMNTFPDEL